MSSSRRARVEDDGDASGDDMPGSGAGAIPISMSAALPMGASMLSKVMRSVVKIFASHAKPNFAQPWAMRPPSRSTSSGFIIAGRYIVTNAHSVSYSTLVQVRKQGAAEKVTARVIAMAHDCDLAVLTVDDPAFFKGVPALELSTDLPRLQEELVVVGYPLGGDQISITQGVTSRIDYGTYSFSTRDHVVVQTDSAINSGNSGGPCFNAQGKVVGVAFQSLSEAEAIGYIVPTEILVHMLTEIKKTGTTRNFPRLGMEWQSLENAHLKAYHKLPSSTSGILVTKVAPVSSVARLGLILPYDVVTAMDGTAIADDGTVAFPYRPSERIQFGYLLGGKFVGDTVQLSVVRGGVHMTVAVPLEDSPELVPHSLQDRKPSYLVHAGLVFTPLTIPYLANAFGKEWDARAPIRLVNMAYHRCMERAGQEVVVLSSLLSNSVAVGYEESELGSLPLTSVNGVKVNNLREAARLIRDCAEPNIVLHFTEDKMVVLPRALANKATEEVMAQHAIPAAMSADLAAALAAEDATAAAAASGAGASSAPSSSASAGNSESSSSSSSAAVTKEEEAPKDGLAAPAPAAGSKRKGAGAAKGGPPARKAKT